MTPPASPGQPGGKHSHPSRLKIAVFLLLCLTGGQSIFCRDTDESSIRIASYNVENYGVIPRPDGGGILHDAGKPLAERDAVARMIADLHPDILGLMEIGEPQQFEDLRARLKKAGVDYPFAEYLQGSDPVRHLALLSRFPITARHSEGDVSVSVDGIPLHSPRGILDVTLEPVPGKSLRVLCVHLKAKIGVPEYDESRLREAEASHLRKHVREILRKEPSAGIVLMGDFNDAPDSRTLREVEGKPCLLYTSPSPRD